MRPNLSSLALALCVGVAAPHGAALADETATSRNPLAAGGLLDDPNPDLVFTLGAGVRYGPGYFGDGNSEFGPTGTFRLDYIRFPNGFTFGSSRSVGFREGFEFHGSGRFIGSRKASDYPELAGLKDIDWTLELGLGVGYEARNFRVYGDTRYGFFGHESFVGELGADVIVRPSERLTINFGPRIDLGDSKYSRTYFGVTPAESVASGMPVYTPGSGVVSAGLELNARYLIDDRWGIEGQLKWSRMLNDAADSPIVLQGDANDVSIRVNIVRRISLNF